jgi:RNA polymerase sigma-70 factor (ECF subfamily)
MPAPDDSGSVVQQLMEGRNVDENFHRLFQRYYSPVSGFFFRKGFAHEDCRDLTQEVFVAVYAGIASLRSEGAFVTWLFSIARHVSLRHLDRQRKYSPVASAVPCDGDDASAAADSIAARDPDPLSRMLDIERVEVLHEALRELPGRVQDCLRARLIDGLGNKEIGDRLGISENTVAVHVHRGLKGLKTRLRIFYGELPLAGDF